MPEEESWRAAAAQDWEPPDEDELAQWEAEPLTGVQAGWRDEVPAAELADWDAALEAQPAIGDPDAAWFAAGCPGAGVQAAVSVFSAEAAGESMRPGLLLAGLSEQAFGHGLGVLTDDALVGLLRATRRLAAWQDGVALAAVAELDARRLAAAARPGSSRASEHVSEELALALVLTGRSADMLLGHARELTRLPVVAAARLAGQIDKPRAVIFTEELAALDAAAAREIAAAVIEQAGSWTTGQLRMRLRAMVLLVDANAARRRAKKARDDARVETWQELSGNGALAGRELPAAEMVAADARITAIALALQSAGAVGPLDQLRADVFCALLLGRDPEGLLHDGGESAPGDGDAPSFQGGACGPGLRVTGLAALAGSVHLTLPAATWLGLSDAPGELPVYGPVDGWTARDLAARLAAQPGTRWDVTLTGPDGRAVAHASARAGPPRETGPPAALTGWLAGLEFAWLETAPCTHRRMTVRYRPGIRTRKLVVMRHRRCAFPGCRRPARRCDLDHTKPWADGGLTCECNLTALCRRHHRAKQGPGWHVEQPAPGTLIWTAPHGRMYVSTPDPYLA